ncbi:U-box domain-containing protein [Musa troglodytarum]|uniref:RING-type E3 ubiquitin transferase n=1 Tax=Musa troglodytarum TaxID=320322 RepID=A0A9E7JTK5_9LILI|nr:U-box domain-containing protein [Musa troglodytarum]
MGSSASPHGEMKDEDRVFVAVEKDVREGRANFVWVLQNTAEERKITVVHVHRPARKFPTALGWFPANQLEEQEVAAYRNIEREKMHKCVDEYLNMCASVKVQKAEKLVIERDDVGKGLVELIALHGITKLVMGAAPDRCYSRRMKAPKSKTALAVQEHADPSCKIWFICKGNLICTRDASLDGPIIAQSPTGSPNSISSQSEMQRSRLLHETKGKPVNVSSLTPMMQDLFSQRLRSANFTLCPELTMSALPDEGLAESSISGSIEGSVIDPWDDISRGSEFAEASGRMASLPVKPQDLDKEDESLILPSVCKPEGEHLFRFPQHDLQDLGVDEVMYKRLRAALSEAKDSKREAYEEVFKRQKAEKSLNDSMQKVRVIEILYTKEVKLRKEIEETLEKEKVELLTLKQQRDQILEELQKAHQKMEKLQLQISDCEQTLKDARGKLSEAYNHLNSIRQEHEAICQERDNAVRENEKLRQKKGDATICTQRAETFSDFSRLELVQATENFHESSKIGEGGYGCVYKGFLRHTTVAIKRLDPQGMQGKTEFLREMDILCNIRHPNLVTLIGACPEALALVYEFLPNGNLEDRLTCMDNAPPLTWQARIRIAVEICSALVFLHSCKPANIVHGDLKPANILLDENYVSKLGDFGIWRLLIQSINSTILYHCTRQPKGTFAYMDPELLTSREITAKSDVYSFGVILLQLLTGRPALGISRVVQEALDMKCLDKIFDASAGDWPYVQAEKLAKLGLKCCEMNTKNRPDAKEAWRILEPLMKSVSFVRLSSSSIRLVPEDSSSIPSYFICPIFKEIMRDPQIAADGFTYEAEAIEGWLHGGRDTSPMTNLRLSHHELIRNDGLRSAIQAWVQQQN